MRGIRALFLLGGVAIAAWFPFTAVILASRGFSVAEIGLVTGVSAVVFTVAIPVWGHLADVRFGRVGALAAASIGAGLSLVAFGLPWPPLVLAGMIVMFSVFEAPIGPLSDAVAVNAIADPSRGYGRIRLIASFGFAVAGIAAGFLYDITGYGPAGTLYAAGAVLLALSLLWVPDVPRARLGDYRREPGRGGSFRVAFEVQPRLPAVLLAVGLVFVGVLAGFTYLGIRIVELGGRPSDVALSASISAFGEIPGMMVAGRIARRIGLRGLFALGALVYAGCTASWIWLASPVAIIATRAITGPAFAALVVSSVLTMSVLLPDRLQGTGQGLFGTTALGVAAVVANLAGGAVYGSAGSGALFAIGAILTVAAAVVAWRVLPAQGELVPSPEAEWLAGEPVLVPGETGGR